MKAVNTQFAVFRRVHKQQPSNDNLPFVRHPNTDFHCGRRFGTPPQHTTQIQLPNRWVRDRVLDVGCGIDVLVGRLNHHFGVGGGRVPTAFGARLGWFGWFRECVCFAFGCVGFGDRVHPVFVPIRMGTRWRMRTGGILTGDAQPRRRCQLLIRQHIPFVFGPHIPHPIVGNQQFCNINVPTTFGVLPFTKGGDQTLNIDTTMVNHLIPTDVIGVQVGVSFALSKGFGHRFETFIEIQFTFPYAGDKGFYVQPFGIER